MEVLSLGSSDVYNTIAQGDDINGIRACVCLVTNVTLSLDPWAGVG